MNKGRIYFNQSPYQKQIIQYQKNEEYLDILSSVINDLEKGMASVI